MPPKRSNPKKAQKQSSNEPTIIDLTSNTVDPKPKRRRLTPEEEVQELQNSLKSFLKPDEYDKFVAQSTTTDNTESSPLSQTRPKRNRVQPKRYQDEKYVELMLRDDDNEEEPLYKDGEDYDHSSSSDQSSVENSEASVITDPSDTSFVDNEKSASDDDEIDEIDDDDDESEEEEDDDDDEIDDESDEIGEDDGEDEEDDD